MEFSTRAMVNGQVHTGNSVLQRRTSRMYSNLVRDSLKSKITVRD